VARLLQCHRVIEGLLILGYYKKMMPVVYFRNGNQTKKAYKTIPSLMDLGMYWIHDFVPNALKSTLSS